MIELLKYYIKKRRHVIIIISTIAMMLMFSIVAFEDFCYTDPSGVKHAQNLPFAYFPIIIIILTMYFVISEFSFKTDKVAIDQLYSLPIKKYKLFITKYIIGLIEIILPMTFSFIVMLLIFLTKEHMFNLSYLWLYYLGLIWTTMIMYTCYVFVFTRCNTVKDGIVNMLLWTFALTVIVGVVRSIYVAAGCFYKDGMEWCLVKPDHNVDGFDYTFASPIIYLTNIMSEIAYNNDIAEKLPYCIESIVVISVLSIAMGILFFVLLRKDKSENATQKSESIFSYNSLIPIYVFCGIVLLRDATWVAILCVIVVGYLLYVVKNRSFKIQTKDLLVLLITVALAIFAAVIIQNIEIRIGGLLYKLFVE